MKSNPLDSNNNDDLDYRTLVALREQKQKYQNERQNPFLISQPHTDKALYKAQYKFDADAELNDYLAPLRVKRKKRPLTKFDILMQNPKRKSNKKKDAAAIKDAEEKNEEEIIEEEELQHPNEKHQDEEQEKIVYGALIKDLFEGKKRLKMNKIQNAIFEDDSVREHILTLKTGEDAISFFAKYGGTTPIKFLNCVRAQNTSQFRPYDLIIIHDYEEILKLNEYFTVSSSGIVHVYTKGPKRFVKALNKDMGATDANSGVPQEESAEFNSLSDWMKESTQFNIQSNIHFFKNYVNCKIFNIWRANVKYRIYCNTRQKLINNVFFCKPVFANNVIEINKILYEVHIWEMVNFHNLSTKNVDVEEFKGEQRNTKQKVAKEYDSIFEKIIACIQAVIKQVHGNKNEKFTSDLEKMNFGKQIKQKPIYLIKKEKEEEQKRKEQADYDYSMLGHFIRFINYMSLETQIRATNNSMVKMRDEMYKEERKNGLFTTMAYFEPNVISFNNKDDEIQSAVDSIQEEMIKTVRGTTKILGNPDFEQYTRDLFASGIITGEGLPDISQIIPDSVEYKVNREEVKTKIKLDFANCRKYVDQHYNQCRRIEDEREKFKIDEWRKEEHVLVDIKQKISQMREFRKLKDEEIKDYSHGIFHVESKTIRKTLTDFVESSLNGLKEYLYEFMKKKAEETHDEFRRVNANIQKPMTKLSTYCDYIKEYMEACELYPQQDTNRVELESMSKLLKMNQKTLTNHDNAKLASINEECEDFRKAKEEADINIKDKRTEMVGKIEETVEKLSEKIYECIAKVNSDEQIDEETPIPEALKKISVIEKECENLQKKYAQLDEYHQLMSLTVPPMKELKELTDKFAERSKIWYNLDSYTKFHEIWYKDSFKSLNVDDVEKKIKQFDADCAMAKTRIQLLSKDGTDKVLTKLHNKVRMISGLLPIIMALGNKDLNEGHWIQIFEQLENGAQFISNMQAKRPFSLSELITNNIEHHKDFVEEISARASGEASIESDLERIKKDWSELNFVVEPYRTYKDKFILKEVADIVSVLDEHQLKLQTMLAVRYVAGIRSKVEEWENKLALVQSILDEWLSNQQQWIYLQNIFGAEDIQKQLPGETARFLQVDKSWKDTMQKAYKKPNVQENCGSEEVLKKFQENNKILDKIQKMLEDYLEKKRKAFPRFYFLSNDELLEILSQTRNPHAVQPHLRKCFDNIQRIKFTEGKESREIVAMISAEPEIEPEIVEFSNSVMAAGIVETWLSNIEDMMRVSLYDQTKLCYFNYPSENVKEREEWFKHYPSQAILVVDMIKWTEWSTEAILKFADGDDKALTVAYEMIIVVINHMVQMVRGDLSVAVRETIKSLMVLDVHNRDVSEQQANQKINSLNDFEWGKQLRYYWEVEPEENCFARQTNTRFKYGYEYLGNGTRLVITPLTDKCYMTLTGALYLHFGGAPAGPAGTGKTETTKDLAKALAIQCIVFNCSDSLEYKTMGRFFAGLAQCGAWACFDEFNRIGIEVQSVIAQQILTIQNAIRNKQDELEFEGKLIPLNMNFGVFITMNPGYAGRTELPDNLKALFRPVAMMIPDYALIAEIILFSEGFVTARMLSTKMVYLYKLSSEQLSKQKHYDFGMRAVKSVLVMAGTLTRQNPDDPEDIVLQKAMRDSNVPKFLKVDLKLFFGIIDDLFPGKQVELAPHYALKEQVSIILKEWYLQEPPIFITKIIQLLETIIVRHGIMTVGSTGTGKSTFLKVLQKALTDLGKREDLSDPLFRYTKIYSLNPKSITQEELFGFNDIYTNTFTHGIVSKIITGALEESNDIKKWVHFDGPVDAGWIENMNTVLDDNKMLCLPDGKRIKLPSAFTMVFEVQDLAVASPATVSRCGMVYLDDNLIEHNVIIDTWWLHFRERERNYMLEKDPKKAENWELPNSFNKFYELITKIFDEHLVKQRVKCKEMIPSVDCNLTTHCLKIIDCLWGDYRELTIGNKQELKEQEQEVFLSMIFIFAFIWSVGGNLNDESRPKLNEEMRINFIRICQNIPEGDLYEYYIDLNSRKFKHWNTLVTDFKYDSSIAFSKILVDTTDTARFKYLLRLMNKKANNVLVMGETGVGKSVIVKDYLSNLPVDDFVNTSANFSAQTSSANIMDLLYDKLMQRGRDLGPPSGKKMVFFVDDINMPKLDTYGSQPPNEFLRQIIDQGGFYDQKKYQIKMIKDICMVAACAPPRGGRNPVTPRLFRHFHMLWMPELSSKSMQKIFTSILKGYLNEGAATKGFEKTAENIIKASIDIYLHCCKVFLPTPAKPHYVFNLRDLSKVIQGVLQMKHEHIDSSDELVCLWVHEECRIFKDRLSDDTDRTNFLGTCQGKIKSYFNIDLSEDSIENLIFTNFISMSQEDYQRASNFDEIQHKIQDFMGLYRANTGKDQSLVFFKDAIKHLCRITRALRQPRGNVQQIGVGGSGRQSLSNIATYIAKCKLFIIEITKNYKDQQWKDDIKRLLKMCGKEGKDDQKVTFLFNDTQVIRESMLEDINNLLNTGEVPNLMLVEDIEEIVSEIRPKAKEAGVMETKDAMMGFFVQTCRENLHIALAFSPVGDKLRDRCRQFPSLINCCTIDWFDRWPLDALRSVALKELNANEQLGIGDWVEDIATIAVEIHTDCIDYADRFWDELKRKYYITPTSYQELMRIYTTFMTTQQTYIPLKIKKYEIGLERLAETNEKVAGLQKQIIEFQPILEENSKANAIQKEDLEEKNKIATETETVVSAEAADIQKVRDEVDVMKRSCEKDLAEALPALHKAQAAAQNIDKGYIAEIKKLNAPSAPIRMVASCLNCIFGRKEDWDHCRKFLGEMDFFTILKGLNPMDVPEKNWIKARKNYLSQEDFNATYLRDKISVAIGTIADYCINMEIYYIKKKEVDPKEKAKAEAVDKLNEVEAVLEKKMSALREIKNTVAELSRNLDASTKKAQSLQDQQERAKKQLERAEKLLSGLGEESERWKVISADLKLDLYNLVGNMLLSSAGVSYIAPFTAEYRKELLKRWMDRIKSLNIPIGESCSIEKLLGNPIQIREWQNYGLPADELSIENAIILTNCRRWPLMIDPQSQANKWIKSMKADQNLVKIKLTQQNFARYLENAIRFGNPVILENVEETLDPVLEPVLTKQIVKKGAQYQIKLGDQEIPYNQEFRFYITTKMPNPHYVPEITIKVTLINFNVTPTGLDEQLLIEVFKNEKPEQEELRDTLIVQISDDNKQLVDLQDKILRQINDVQGNILDDEEIIVTLGASKITSETINKRMVEAKATNENITKARNQYKTVSARGTILYFVIVDQALIDPMYQYSLDFFITLFKKRLEVSEKSDEINKRKAIQIDDLTLSMYKNICRGLFEVHKLLFSFLISAKICLQNKTVSPKEWQFFMQGSFGELREWDDRPEYIPEKMWAKLKNLQGIHYNFDEICRQFESDALKDTWKSIIEADLPLSIPLPIEKDFQHFQELLIYYVLCEEKLMSLVKRFVSKELGKTYIESPPFDLKASYDDSTAKTPIIFVLSSGADPMSNLLIFAKSKEMDGSRFKILSLGQGQGEKAEEQIKTARLNGDWVCLQNCHLATSWMTDLERIQEIQVDIHPDYRLWLTSMPTPNFPVPVLQSGIKITNEPPKGIKANVGRSFLDIDETWYNTCSKDQEFKKMFFGLCLFHAIILERKKYGAIGWNIPYGWMNSDLETCQLQLKIYIDEQPEIPYSTLRYVVAVISYGGRVTDQRDERLISAMYKGFCNEEILNEEGHNISDDGIYRVPKDCSLEGIKEYVDTLPLDDTPEIFGLHSNANLTYSINTCKLFMGYLVQIQPKSSGNGSKGMSVDKIILNQLTEFEKLLPQPIKFNYSEEASCLHIFRAQELDRFNILLKGMKKHMSDLKDAINGLVVMSLMLEKMFNAMVVKQVPLNWESIAYPSQKPLSSWFEDLVKRCEFMKLWVDNDYLPAYWVSAFFFPQGFMTAALQTYARKTKIPIDKQVFKTEMQDEMGTDKIEGPVEGVYIYGHFLEGCKWNTKKKLLVESDKNVLFQLIPSIWIYPVRVEEYDDSNTYSCPVYKTSLRKGELSTTGQSTNWVMMLDVPTKDDPTHWINRGVAMVYCTDD